MKRLVAILLAVVLVPVAGRAQSPNWVYGAPAAGQSSSGVRWDVRLPEDAKLVDGFTLDIQAENTLLVGYHPVRLTALSTSKFSADRTIEIQFQPVDSNVGTFVEGRIRSLIVCTLEMPQGAPSASKDVYLPHYTYDSVYKVRVSEAGRKLLGYELTLGTPRQPNTISAIPNRIGVLLPREVVGGNSTQPWQRTPDPSALLQVLRPHSGLLPSMQGVAIAIPGMDVHQQALSAAFPLIGCTLTEDQLWDNWLGYEALDILILPLPMLQRLEATDPSKAEAIRHFAAAGGTLWLYAAENEDAVHQVFKTVPLSDAALAAHRNRIRRELRSVEYSQLPTGVWIQDYAAGRLVCIADAYPFPGTSSTWRTLLNANPAASNTTVRRGVDPTFGDSRFWHWVLPNVARPPVYPFLTLLGLFALCVGPLAYRISSQLNRIYLMLLAAPVMALLTTVLMIGYGLLSDGLGYQTRIREVTWVDSPSGTGLRWTRSTYFAGIRPPDGLHFDAHSAVYPYPQERIERLRLSNEEPAAGRIVLHDDEQNFAFGFLPSRQQRQFVTFTPKEDLGGVSAAPLENDSFVEKRPVRNRFRFPLRSLIMRDDQGDYWYAERVDAQKTIDAVRYANLLAATKLRKIYSENVLEFPGGFQQPRRSQNASRNRYDLVSNAALELPQAYRSINDGLVESRLRSMLQVEGQLPQGHFFAIADVTPDVVALPDSKLSDSIHFCIGTWQ